MSDNGVVKDYLTSVAELSELIGQPCVAVIDTREPEDYQVDHIPGAVNIYDIFTYLSTIENGGYDAMRLHFARLFGEAGISGNERVIVYEDAMDNGYGRSCRGYFLLKHLGCGNVTVLHGGYQAWVLENKPITRSASLVNKKLFELKPDNSIIIDHLEMLESLSNPGIIVLDCRDRAEWVGISSSPYGPDFAPRKGRIPGAVWIEWYNSMKSRDNIPWFKEPDELKTLFAANGITTKSKIHIYCFKGARTSNMFLALKLAGIKYVRNYVGSWNEWSRITSLPIETGYPKRKKNS